MPYISSRVNTMGLCVKNLYIYVGIALIIAIALVALSIIAGIPFQLGGSSGAGYGKSLGVSQITYEGSTLAYVITPNSSITTINVSSTIGNITIPIPGKINVMTPQYIRCPDICHWETYVLVYLMNRTISYGLSGNIVFVTIDVDPWRDSYGDVTSYQRSRAGDLLDKVSWIWVLGDVDSMTRVWENFRIFVARSQDGLITHSAGFYIFDKDGKIIYMVQPTDEGWRNLDKLAPRVWDLLYKIAKQ